MCESFLVQEGHTVCTPSWFSRSIELQKGFLCRLRENFRVSVFQTKVVLAGPQRALAGDAKNSAKICWKITNFKNFVFFFQERFTVVLSLVPKTLFLWCVAVCPRDVRRPRSCCTFQPTCTNRLSIISNRRFRILVLPPRSYFYNLCSRSV